MKKNISKGICLVTAMCLLAGCGDMEQTSSSGQVEPVLEENTITYQLLESPQLDYPLPEPVPGLCVPSGGYDVTEDKLAHVYGKLIPEEFYLLEKESGQVVYTGEFSEVKYHKDTERYSAIADFSSYAETGEYVLQCDYLGYSYSFSIEEKLQENFLAETVEGFSELFEKSEDLQNNVDGALLLLLSYDFYGQVYATEENTPDVLRVVNEYTEGLAQAVKEEDATWEYDPYMLAALLAKHGHIYQNFDWNAGNDAIKLAKKLWKAGEKQELSSEYKILAAAELYRATGTYSYRKLVQDYFQEQIDGEMAIESSYDILAALTHFKTDYKVNRGLCTALMEEILDRAEVVAAYITLDNQLLGSGGKENKLAETMWNMVYVSVVEYVITNYEYGDLLENQYFYLQGRNPQAYDYVSEMIMKNPRWAASYVMMLCEHLAHDHLK